MIDGLTAWQVIESRLDDDARRVFHSYAQRRAWAEWHRRHGKRCGVTVADVRAAMKWLESDGAQGLGSPAATVDDPEPPTKVDAPATVQPDGQAAWELLRPLLDNDRRVAVCLTHASWRGYRQWFRRHGEATGLDYETVKAAMRWGWDNRDPGVEADHEAAWEPRSIKVKTTPNDDGTITVTAEGDIRSLAELYEAQEIDSSRWRVVGYEPKAWTTGMNIKGMGPCIIQQHSIGARLQPRLDHDIRPVERTSINWTRLPESDRSVKADGILTAVLFGDIQTGFVWTRDRRRMVPLHDRSALDVMVQVVDWLRPDTVGFVGDDLDLAEISKYPSGPGHQYTIQASLDEHHMLISRVRALVPEADIIEWAGNHDHRFQQALEDKVGALAQLGRAGETLADRKRAFTLRNLLRYDELGVITPSPEGELHDECGEYDTPWPLFKADPDRSPLACHGTSHSKTACEVLASTYPDRSVAQGHVHKWRCINVSKPRLRRAQQVRWYATLGCLCHVDGRVPGFKGPRDWQQGGAIVSHDLRTGESWIEQILIRAGQAIVRGRRFVGVDRTDDIARALGLPMLATAA